MQKTGVEMQGLAVAACVLCACMVTVAGIDGVYHNGQMFSGSTRVDGDTLGRMWRNYRYTSSTTETDFGPVVSRPALATDGGLVFGTARGRLMKIDKVRDRVMDAVAHSRVELEEKLYSVHCMCEAQ